jgi:CheY-like chemotaxis protein
VSSKVLSSNGHKNVMVVDDDEDIRESIADVLRECGYEVECAMNGRDAMSKLRGGVRPSVILLDLMMPVMDGWQFRAEQVEDPRLAGIPVIVISAAGANPGVPEGTCAYLRKPFNLKDLLREIERWAA